VFATLRGSTQRRARISLLMLACATRCAQNPAIQQKMAALQGDPEFKEFFDAVRVRRAALLTLCVGCAPTIALSTASFVCRMQTGGPAALTKFWNDEALLAKISQRLGSAGPPPPQQQAAPQGPPEVTNLRDAARYGDIEAVEDFLSIKKDVNEQDKEGRSPLCVALRCVGAGQAAPWSIVLTLSICCPHPYAGTLRLRLGARRWGCRSRRRYSTRAPSWS
jgi:hypothetical protein